MYVVLEENKVLLWDKNKDVLRKIISNIPQYRAKKIEEMPIGYAIYDGYLVTETEAEPRRAQAERERINMLSLTAADVERAIYKAKGMDFEDILELVRESQTRESQFVNRESGNIDIDQSQTSSTDYNNDNTAHESRVTTHEIDLKALKIELKANNFYRGNPYIEQVGALLGFTPQMLDEFFETGDYTKLAASAKEQDSNAVEERVQNAPFDINTESEGK